MSTCTCDGTKEICNCNLNHLSDSYRYFIELGGRGAGKTATMNKIKEMFESRERYKPNPLRKPVAFYNPQENIWDEIQSARLDAFLSNKDFDTEAICKAFNYPSELLSNQTPLDMNDDSLQKGLNLSDNIHRLKGEIKRTEACNGISGISFLYGDQSMRIDASVVNFSAIKKQVLASMKKKLAAMEKEFANL